MDVAEAVLLLFTGMIIAIAGLFLCTIAVVNVHTYFAYANKKIEWLVVDAILLVMGMVMIAFGIFAFLGISTGV